MLAPALSSSSTSTTRIRVDRIHGRPPHLPASMVMRFNRSAFARERGPGKALTIAGVLPGFLNWIGKSHAHEKAGERLGQVLPIGRQQAQSRCSSLSQEVLQK